MGRAPADYLTSGHLPPAGIYTIFVSDGAGPNSNLAAASRSLTHQELWWVNADGRLCNKHYDREWKAYPLDNAPVKPNFAVSSKSRLAAATRNSKNTAVFYLTPTGHVRGACFNADNKPSWDEGKLYNHINLTRDGWPVYKDNKPVFIDNTARVDSDIKAISFIENQYEVVWVGPANSLCSTTICPPENGRRPMHREIIMPAGSVAAGRPLGIFKMEKGYGVCFVDSKGKINMGYCTVNN